MAFPRITSALLAAAALLAAPATASAFSFAGVEYVDADGPTSMLEVKRTDVRCPPGKRVIGAGAEVLAAGAAQSRLITLQAITPAADLTSVAVSARANPPGPSAAWSLRAYATCASVPAVHQLERVAEPSQMDSMAHKAALAECPEGKRVVGSGAELMDGSGDVVLHTVRPSDDLRTAYARAAEDVSGSAAHWRVTAYAICARPTTNLALTGLELATGALHTVEQGSYLLLKLCSPGKRALSAGGTVGGAARIPALFARSPEGAYLLGLGDSALGTPAWTIRGHAVCDYAPTSWE